MLIRQRDSRLLESLWGRGHVPARLLAARFRGRWLVGELATAVSELVNALTELTAAARGELTDCRAVILRKWPSSQI